MRLSKQHGPSFNGLFVGGLAASLFGVASAGYQSAVPSSPGGSGGSGSSGSCTFSISSTGGIACPAGQLADGQIRLNGSEPTAYFTISNGQITDSSGRGCIVTDPPTTQVQCDQGKAPFAGFSISGAENTLSYQGNATFWACPATDTEYNIYIDPNFGQTKCFPIGLTADGCGSCQPPVTVTAWQTTTVTVTSSAECEATSSESSSSSSQNSVGTLSTAICHKCNGTSYHAPTQPASATSAAASSWDY